MTEFDLIYRYFQQPSVATQNIDAQNKTLSLTKGIGDDAAVLAFKADGQLVTCVDTLIQGRHFSDDWAQVKQLAFAIGYKAVAVNVSDIAAMGAAPHSILLALALPQQLANETWLGDFAQGLFHACQQFGVQLIGGDTTRHDKVIISITANGVLAPQTAPIYRSGAQVGDKLYVSGTLGDASYALQYLDSQDSQLQETEQPNLEALTIAKQLSHRLHMPTPRLHLGQALAEQGQATAMIDISDGLAQDLGHICAQSGVGMRVNLETLPTSQPLQRVAIAQRLQHQLSGGDDYELAFTLPANVLPPKTTTPVTCIGEVVTVTDIETDKRPIYLMYQGSAVTPNTSYPFAAYPNLAGFGHFKAE